MKLKKIWIAALGIAVIAVGGIYAGKAIHYQNKGIFMSNTTFSGIDIGGKTIGKQQKPSIQPFLIVNSRFPKTKNRLVNFRPRVQESFLTQKRPLP